jgi:hypothetical protein
MAIQQLEALLTTADKMVRSIQSNYEGMKGCGPEAPIRMTDGGRNEDGSKRLKLVLGVPWGAPASPDYPVARLRRRL